MHPPLFKLYIYPPYSNDHGDAIIIAVGPQTIPSELQAHVALAFGKSATDLVQLTYHPSGTAIIVPYSSLYQFLCATIGDEEETLIDVSMRARFHDENTSEKAVLAAKEESCDSDLENGSTDSAEPEAGVGTNNDPIWENQQYFSQYSKIGIHWNMLKDEKRNEKYREAMNKFGDLKDKVVMDVGCGTGFLSVLAAQAGSKKVYAIEASDMHEYASKVIIQNNVQDIVQVIHSQIENLDSLPGEYQQVDIIVSEWMGVFLVYESMLESVIYARDKWLKPDGRLYPAEANLYVAPLAWKEWWDQRLPRLMNVSGVDLSPIQEFAAEDFSRFPLKGNKKFLSEYVLDKPTDLKTISPDQYRSFECHFKFKPKGDRLDGFITWFDVVFKGGEDPDQEGKVVLSTTPFERPTHWYQDVFMLGETVKLQSSGALVVGTLKCFQSPSHRRHYEAQFRFKVSGTIYEQEFIL